MATMITGELDYSDVFGLSYDVINDTMMEENMQNILYPETTNFVWLIFLVFIPILLSNMLVSENLSSYNNSIILWLTVTDWLSSWRCY